MRLRGPFNPILLALTLLAATCGVQAGPIQSDPLASAAEPPPLLSPAAAPPAVSPMVAPPPPESAATLPSPLLSSQRAASAGEATGSELAAEVMLEAEVGDGATRASARLPLRPASVASGANTLAEKSAQRQDDAELTQELRAFGKTAWSWAKSIMPWNVDEPDDLEGERALPPTQINWSHGPSATDGTPDAAVLHAANAATAHTSAAGGDPAGRVSGSSAPGDQNLVRDAVRLITQVVGHPMTWLIVSLLVIGGFAVSLADRRPK